MSDSKLSNGSDGEAGLFTTADALKLYTKRIEDKAFFPQERKAVDRYFTKTDGSVLDVGCGVGRVSSLLHERGFDVTGIDISPSFIKDAQSRFPEIDFRTEDIRNTDFEAESFDYVVFSWFGLDYLTPKSERIEALREINRLLKPSGILLFSTHNSVHPLVPLSLRNFGLGLKDVFDLYLRKRNWRRLFSRYKIESVTLGDVEIYLTNPVHQWLQLRKCGYTPIDIIGERDGLGRFFERDPHFVAKK